MLPAFPHQPGSLIKRYSPAEDYKPDQMARWFAVDDAYYAVVNGQEALRHASLGAVLNQKQYENWQKTMASAWEYESRRQHGSVGMKADDMPENLRLYLFERLCAEAA